MQGSDHSRCRQCPAERLAEVFVEVADTLVDDFDLIEFLQMVTAHTSELVDARAAGLLLAGPAGPPAADGRLRRARQDARAVPGPGPRGPVPGLLPRRPAGRSTRTCEPPSTAGPGSPRTPWRPASGPCTPSHCGCGSKVIGALNLFGTDVGRHGSPADVRVVQALADVATIGLLQERAIRRGEVLTEQLQTALNSRIVIEQAKGVLAQIHGTTPDEAFELLRDYCRSHHARLSDIAAAVLTDPASLPELTTPRP